MGFQIPDKEVPLRNLCPFFAKWVVAPVCLFACSCGSHESPWTEQDTDTTAEDIKGGDQGMETDTGVSEDTNNSDPLTDTDDTGPVLVDTESDVSTEGVDLYSFAGGCFALSDEQGHWLRQNAGGDGYRFIAGDPIDATSFYMKASDLGTYLLYDSQAGYVYADDGPIDRRTSLDSDISLLDDSYVSGAEWELKAENKASDSAAQLYYFSHRKTGKVLTAGGISSNSNERVRLRLTPTTGCLEHPELSLDAVGNVKPRTFDDGDLYGIVETHTHLLTNFGFGGGNIFHGAPFHRLGVEHAFPDCAKYHGDEGRKDFFGYGAKSSGGMDAGGLVSLILNGELPEQNHATAGYPDFTDWPNGPSSPTHQTQYYLWLKRAWMGGLRLLVQLATTNSVMCELMVGMGLQPARYSCNDMVAVDRIIDETYAMERYIDAQAGGPGKGFFRIVTSPERAREEIMQGKLAIILGIETSNLFNCFSVPRSGMPICDEKYVVAQLDKYHERGIRVIFPVHKYDNAFTAGDGQRGFIEIGNFINSGHWSSFVEDCPQSGARFDHGHLYFSGLNEPREDYFSTPPNNMAMFQENPIAKLLPHLSRIMAPPLEGEFCQKHGLTDLGDFLIRELIKRGMIIDIDHLPKRSYNRVLDMILENDYPATGTHASEGLDGNLYDVGGMSMFGFGRCRDPKRKGAMLDDLRRRLELKEKHGAYPGIGIGLDLNGLAGAPRPRFGPNGCKSKQEDPVTYPFTDYAGDITFTEPKVGKRTLDFNTEGLVHIGLLPEMIEDARKDAESEADLEPIFRSAEAYLRMWERCEERSQVLRNEL